MKPMANILLPVGGRPAADSEKGPAAGRIAGSARAARGGGAFAAAASVAAGNDLLTNTTALGLFSTERGLPEPKPGDRERRKPALIESRAGGRPGAMVAGGGVPVPSAVSGFSAMPAGAPGMMPVAARGGVAGAVPALAPAVPGQAMIALPMMQQLPAMLPEPEEEPLLPAPRPPGRLASVESAERSPVGMLFPIIPDGTTQSQALHWAAVYLLPPLDESSRNEISLVA